jgi:hypothetical protein
LSKQDVTVEVRRHTMSIAGQIYQLRNIARVQNLTLTPDRTHILGKLFGRGVVAVVALVIFNAIVGQGMGLSSGSLTVLNAIAVIVLGGFAIKYLVAASRKPWYILLMETTGSPFGVLYSKQSSQIDKLVSLIWDAMENPPTSPRLMHIGDVVMGDKLKMIGDRNIGKLVDG